MDVELVREVEQVAANAYEVDVLEELDGWRLRYAQSGSRRGNSVWPNLLGGELSLAARLGRVEEFYAARGRPARFQMTPAALPVELDEVLVQRGYFATAPTLVQAAPVEEVLAHTLLGRAMGARVAGQPDQEWLAAAAHIKQPAHGLHTARGEEGRPARASGYALLREGGEPVALGRAVLERGWLGLFDIVTAEHFRRRGAATAVLYALAAWGKARGARQVYLQVMEENLAARTLYARAGFETLYAYYYRERGARSEERGA